MSSIRGGGRVSKKKNIIELSVPELRKRLSAGFITRDVKEEDIDYSDIPEVTEELLKTRLKRMPRKKRAL